MNDIVTLGLWGIGSSLLTEAITWVNKKLSNTLLRGRGSFIVIFVISFVAAWIHQGNFSNWKDLYLQASQIFAVSQVWFVLIATKAGIEVK